MGDEQKLTPDEMLTHSREQFEAAQDFTLAVEEEFALLDPETHNLVNRFEDLKAAAAGTELDPHLVGELIASEAEVKTGRCDTFAQASDAMGERREQLAALAGSLGLELSSVGTHPWADW
jgi:carboxylate-amine ligase